MPRLMREVLQEDGGIEYLDKPDESKTKQDENENEKTKSNNECGSIWEADGRRQARQSLKTVAATRLHFQFPPGPNAKQLTKRITDCGLQTWAGASL